MRQIEFRVWHKELEEYVHVHKYCVLQPSGIFTSDCDLEQFTGLHDKNGVKIFEGDILDEDGSLFIVAWDDDWAKFKLQYTSSKSIQYPEWNRGKKMIIFGNIHQNPELLEK